MVSWLEIIDNAFEIAKARLLAAIKKFEDPAATFDEAMRDYEEAVKILRQNVVLMQTKKNWVISVRSRLVRKHGDTEDKVRNYLRNDQENYAKAWAKNIPLINKNIQACDDLVIMLEDRTALVQEELIKAEAAKDAISITAEVEKARLEIAQSLTGVYEQLTGISDRDTTLYEAMEGLVGKREEKEAEALALQQLVAGGLLTTPASQIYGPVEQEAEDILAKIELEIQKTESSSDVLEDMK